MNVCIKDYRLNYKTLHVKLPLETFIRIRIRRLELFIYSLGEIKMINNWYYRDILHLWDFRNLAHWFYSSKISNAALCCIWTVLHCYFYDAKFTTVILPALPLWEQNSQTKPEPGWYWRSWHHILVSIVSKLLILSMVDRKDNTTNIIF